MLYKDNIGAITTAIKPELTSSRSQYIDIRYHITREALINKIFRLKYIRSSDIVADILTKALSFIYHEKHRSSIGLGF